MELFSNEHKKIIKDRLPKQLLNYYHYFSYKQLLRYNQRENLTFEEAEQLISKQYLNRERKVLSWSQPETYTEKICVAKLYGGSLVKTKLADKVLVREWIKNKIGEKYLIPLIGEYTSFDEIDFAKLPGRFVMKCNHDSGSVFLCKNKNNINYNFWNDLKKRYNYYCKRNFAYTSFEMHYKFIVPKILIENYIGDNNEEIYDYKFLCFNGKPYYCWVDADRFTEHRRNVYDLNWFLQPFRITYKHLSKEFYQPSCFDLMKRLVTVLCKGFDQVRVDLYTIHDRIYLGEMTFTTESGLGIITPAEYDYKLGALWKINNEVIQEKRMKLKNVRLKDYTYL